MSAVGDIYRSCKHWKISSSCSIFILRPSLWQRMHETRCIHWYIEGSTL